MRHLWTESYTKKLILRALVLYVSVCISLHDVQACTYIYTSTVYIAHTTHHSCMYVSSLILHTSLHLHPSTLLDAIPSIDRNCKYRFLLSQANTRFGCQIRAPKGPIFNRVVRARPYMLCGARGANNNCGLSLINKLKMFRCCSQNAKK